MKISVLISIFILCISMLANAGTDEKACCNEKKAVEKAVIDHYVKGIQVRDFSLIRKICIPEAIMYSVRNDSTLNVTTLDKWSKRFNPNNPPFKKLDYSIEKVDLVETAAQVKIKFIIEDKRIVHDLLQLLKIKGEWRIVNITDD